MKRVTRLTIIDRLAILVRGKKFHLGVIGILATLTIISVKSSQAQLLQRLEYETLLVSSRALIQGEQLTESDITTQKFLSRHIPAHAYKSTQKEDVVGRYISSSIGEGEVITDTQLLKEGDTTHLDSLVRPSQVLIFLTDDQVKNIPPHIAKGETVALIGAEPKTDKKRVLVARTSVIQTLTDGSKKDAPVIAVAIKIDQNEALSLAQSLADKWLVQLVIVSK